jgi:hypothetical protein
MHLPEPILVSLTGLLKRLRAEAYLGKRSAENHPGRKNNKPGSGLKPLPQVQRQSGFGKVAGFLWERL